MGDKSLTKSDALLNFKLIQTLPDCKPYRLFDSLPKSIDIRL